jgi:hypothetical protein
MGKDKYMYKEATCTNLSRTLEDLTKEPKGRQISLEFYLKVFFCLILLLRHKNLVKYEI